MLDKARIAAKWDDEHGDHVYTLLVNGRFQGEFYSEQAALEVAFRIYGVELEIVYD